MEPKTTESGTTESGTTGATPGVAPIASTPALAFEDFDDYGEEDENAPLTGCEPPVRRAPLRPVPAEPWPCARCAARGNLPKASSGPRSFWQLGYYQSFFNVETDDVLDRLRCALLAYKGQTIFDKNTDADLCVRPPVAPLLVPQTNSHRPNIQRAACRGPQVWAVLDHRHRRPDTLCRLKHRGLHPRMAAGALH